MELERWVVEILEKGGGNWEQVGDADNKKRAQQIERSVILKTTDVVSSRVRRIK